MCKQSRTSHVGHRAQSRHCLAVSVAHTTKDEKSTQWHAPLFLLAAITLLLVWPAYAKSEPGNNLSKAVASVDQTSIGKWRPKAPANPSFNYYFKRFLEKHRIIPEADYRMEATVSPVWLQDDIMGFYRDRPARPRTGAEIGTFYDSSGRLRLWTPSPPPRGKFRVLESPPMELLRKWTKGLVNWKDEKVEVARTLDPERKSELEVMMDKTLRELRDSSPLYKAIAKLTRDTAVDPETSDASQADTSDPTAAEQEPAKDPCTYSDTTLAKITSRMASEAGNPSRVASLAKRFPKSDPMKKLLNCICRVHSGKTSSVSVYYKTTPHDTSPSCNDVSNGPCVGQGYGCSRSKFIPDQEALEECGASRVVAKAICDWRKGI